MKKFDIYLYGMITKTNALLLRGDFPQANAYSEVKGSYTFTGGETGGAATVLASLGCKVKMDGNHTGRNTDAYIREFYGKIGVNVSRLTCAPDYEGIDETIIIDKETRTTFGQYAAYFEDYAKTKVPRWNTPQAEDIQNAKAAGIDPFFGEEAISAARLCCENNVPYVTIDERPAHEVCKSASIIVVSSDWVRDNMPEYCSDSAKPELLKQYTEQNEKALVVVTGGGGLTFYGRGGDVKQVAAHKVDTVSTLGAGDTFKAACIYSLLQGWDDSKTIEFSMACGALACTKFPLPYNPPTLTEVEKFLASAQS